MNTLHYFKTIDGQKIGISKKLFSESRYLQNYIESFESYIPLAFTFDDIEFINYLIHLNENEQIYELNELSKSEMLSLKYIAEILGLTNLLNTIRNVGNLKF